MEKKEIFAARLKNARVMKGYSMDELVAAMGNNISKMAISKYEKCQLSPNSTILISLANALGQPVDYFFRPFTLQIDSVKFRKTKSNLAKKQEESIKENIADLVERYINIEEICDCAVKFCSPFEKEISTREETLFNANELRDYWNLGQDGIVNVIELLEDHGVKVMEVDAPESFLIKRFFFIFYNHAPTVQNIQTHVLYLQRCAVPPGIPEAASLVLAPISRFGQGAPLQRWLFRLLFCS